VGRDLSQFDPDALGAAAVWVKLCRAQLAVSARVFRRLPPRTSLTQFAVLEALDYLGPMYQKEISEKILKSTGNVTVVVDGLERAGLAARRRSSDDRRKVVVEITDDGRRWLYGILPVYLQALKEEFAVLTAEERADLGKLCRILGHGLRSSGDATGRTEVGGAR